MRRINVSCGAEFVLLEVRVRALLLPLLSIFRLLLIVSGFLKVESVARTHLRLMKGAGNWLSAHITSRRGVLWDRNE